MLRLLKQLRTRPRPSGTPVSPPRRVTLAGQPGNPARTLRQAHENPSVQSGGIARQQARSSVPLPEPAVFDPVAAGGHVAPGAGPAVGAIVEGPPAVRV